MRRFIAPGPHPLELLDRLPVAEPHPAALLDYSIDFGRGGLFRAPRVGREREIPFTLDLLINLL